MHRTTFTIPCRSQPGRCAFLLAAWCPVPKVISLPVVSVTFFKQSPFLPLTFTALRDLHFHFDVDVSILTSAMANIQRDKFNSYYRKVPKNVVWPFNPQY